MKKKAVLSFWGKFLFIFIIINLTFCSTAANLSAKLNNPKIQSTIITVETSREVSYKSHFFDNPPRIVLVFQPQTLHSRLKENVVINRGMLKNIQCRYYNSKGSQAWLKSITFFLVAKTNYEIKTGQNNIYVSIQNTPEQSINSILTDEFIVKDYMPRGWGSFQRKQALMAAIKFIRIKRQMAKRLTGVTEPSVLVEKKSDNSVRITAANLTPVEMIATGTKVLLTQPLEPAVISLKKPSIQPPPLSADTQRSLIAGGLVGRALNVTAADIASASLGFVTLIWAVLIIDGIRNKRKSLRSMRRRQKKSVKDEKKIIEELFLKDDELQKWAKSKEIFNFPSPAVDIAERRRFPRADIRNARGILNRALIGSKMQPFKNIKVNDISKGGLSFLVKSKEIKFKSPTIIKLYFANSTKPVDLWVRVVWEKNDPHNDSKNVGVRFTKVPKETWDKIMESFGHRLG